MSIRNLFMRNLNMPNVPVNTVVTGAGIRAWFSISSSANGAKLAAVVNGGYIYTSDNYGETWTQRTSAGYRNWSCIASSADGSKLVAAASIVGGTVNAAYGTDYIYTSSDSGATWVQRTSSGQRCWAAIASSADGSKLVASTSFSEDYIYISLDSGATWNAKISSGARNWRGVALSADGIKMYACDYGGGIVASYDSGTTWAELPSGVAQWQGLACSVDGTKIIAVGESGRIAKSSNSGATWVALTSSLFNGHMYGITCSDDGNTWVTGVYGQEALISKDFGNTWIPKIETGNQSWIRFESDAAGSRVLAATIQNELYIILP